MDKINQFSLDNNLTLHEVEIILEETYNKKITNITDDEFINAQEQLLRLQNEQMQYIINKAWFYGEEFFVNENVLIPRFDTEFVLENTLKNITKQPSLILDLCTGSGILAIMLKKQFPNAKVFASDISEEALKVAKENAKKHNVEIEFIKSDLLTKIPNYKFDLIISNPPYLDYEEEVHWKTKRWEPELALYADNHGLAIYEKLSYDVYNYLNQNGTLSYEIGDKQANAIIKFHTNLELVGVFLDYNERERNIIFRRNS